MGLYGIAKVTTIIEIVLTCNCLLFFEFYGLAERKSIWVLIGMIYRCILVLAYAALGIFILAFLAPFVGGIGTAIEDGDWAKDWAEDWTQNWDHKDHEDDHTEQYEASGDGLAQAEAEAEFNGLNDVFSTIGYFQFLLIFS